MQIGLFSNGERQNQIGMAYSRSEGTSAARIGAIEQRRRSMRLFMAEVAPRLAHLNPDCATA